MSERLASWERPAACSARLVLVLAAVGSAFALGVPGAATDSAEPASDAAALPESDPNGTGPARKATIVFPPDKVVLLHGRFHLIYVGPAAELRIDGRRCAWEELSEPVRVAAVRLSPGMHSLSVDSQVQRVVVALNEMEHDGPANWPIWRYHPIRNDPGCADCHRSFSSSASFPEPHVPNACLECHSPEQLQAVEPHRPEPIQDCRRCHAMHGSPHKALLKAPTEELRSTADPP